MGALQPRCDRSETARAHRCGVPARASSACTSTDRAWTRGRQNRSAYTARLIVPTKSHQSTELLQFTGVRVEVSTTLPFDEVLGRLRSEVGSAPAAELDAATKRSRTADEFAREVNQRVGPSG